jgi:hypothetical protein
VIQVAPSVSGEALRDLSGAYRFSPLRVRVAGPVVVGAADLRDRGITDLLRRDYNSGQAVALANATAKDASYLARLLGYPTSVALPNGVRRADLVVFREVNQGGRTDYSTSIVLPQKIDVPATPAQLQAGERAYSRTELTYLKKVFAATPATPPPPRVSGAAQDLLQIASANSTSWLWPTGVPGASLQVVNTVYAARSFNENADYYYVLQEVDAQNGDDPYLAVAVVNNILYQGVAFPPPIFPVTIQPSPQTNLSATTYTSSEGWSIGGSVGVNLAQGFSDAFNWGVSVNNSQTVTVPPTQILYLGDLTTGRTRWDYGSNNQNRKSGETDTYYNQWIWKVPFAAYGNPTGFPDQIFVATAFGYITVNNPNNTWSNYFLSPARVPFDWTFQLTSPSVTGITVNGVSTSTVNPGEKFTIEGTAMYPSLVKDVLIGGQSVGTANFKPTSDTKIQVVAPNTPGRSLRVVVETQQGYSNDNVTITIADSSGARRLADRGSPIRQHPG